MRRKTQAQAEDTANKVGLTLLSEYKTAKINNTYRCLSCGKLHTYSDTTLKSFGNKSMIACRDCRDPDLVYGVGLNDANYQVYEYSIINGVKTAVWQCPFYRRWVAMLRRSYSKHYHKSRGSYDGCVVCEEWKTFSNFKKWMEIQDWEGKALDKDILGFDSKYYSPETCIFISRELNSFLTDCRKSRGEHLIGASLEKDSGLFKASCNNPFTRKLENLGRFKSEVEAHLTWKKRKHEIANLLCDTGHLLNKEAERRLRSMFSNYYVVEDYHAAQKQTPPTFSA